MGKLTISMAMFNSYVYVYQRVPMYKHMDVRFLSIVNIDCPCLSYLYGLVVSYPYDSIWSNLRNASNTQVGMARQDTGWWVYFIQQKEKASHVNMIRRPGDIYISLYSHIPFGKLT